jgi:hypothetical protein
VKQVIGTWLALTAFIIVAGTGFSAHASSTFYRWQDDRGNPVHSDRPPPAGTPYEVITTGSSLVRQVDAGEGAVPATTEPTVSNDFEPVNTSKAPVKKNPEQCQRARENLQTLNTKARIQVRNDQGELRPLSEEEKEIQRQQAMDVIAVHCEQE